jgi:hypothetical protein
MADLITDPKVAERVDKLKDGKPVRGIRTASTAERIRRLDKAADRAGRWAARAEDEPTRKALLEIRDACVGGMMEIRQLVQTRAEEATHPGDQEPTIARRDDPTGAISLPPFDPMAEMRAEVRRLADRIEALEGDKTR